MKNLKKNKKEDRLQCWSQVFNVTKSPDWGCYVCKMPK